MPPKICPVNHLLLLQPKMQRKNIMGLCSKMKKWKAMVKKCDIFNEFMAEFLGTFILILFGCGSVAQAVVTRGALGNLLTINMGFSLGVMLAVYVAGGVSGAHVNPAVSLAMMILKRLPPEKFPLYLVAQFLGAFAGASVVYGLYYDALMAYTNGVFVVTGPSATAQIFASYPDKSTSVLIGTAALIVGILAVTDEKNNGAPKGLQPLAISLIITAIAVSMGTNGYPINPARDLSPRVLTALTGWGLDVFSAGGYWFWIPLVGPMVGALLGVAVYTLFIHCSEPEKQEQLPGPCEMTTEI
ncbi:aquaporin-9-like isoform X1 [Paralichthys olivaceus]|uniref:aquaporin-9-like isoform X1 n=1 Tax=Paralichthys olivaceus TaxID=8255 RepID=UPI003750BFDC